MKKLWNLLIMLTVVFAGCNKTDDLWDEVHDLQKRLTKLEIQANNLNGNITALQELYRNGATITKIYDGEKAVKDTAYEVRRARNQGIFVIGIFAGNEEELSVEKRIYGKDFAYIRNISNFSRMVGTFLRRQIDME